MAAVLATGPSTGRAARIGLSGANSEFASNSAAFVSKKKAIVLLVKETRSCKKKIISEKM
jgi:hypothetical protein